MYANTSVFKQILMYFSFGTPRYYDKFYHAKFTMLIQ